MELKLLLLFALTELLSSMTPGPAVLLVISQAMRFGFTSSIRGMLGILTGNAIYFALSAAGLSALLIASATLFEVIKWAGAAYLVYVGVRMLISKGEAQAVSDKAVQSRRGLKLFSQGLITQLSNPKAVVFFTALLPQFISPGGRVFEQFLVLGITSIMVEFPVLLVYGLIAERGISLIPKGRLSALPDRVAGVCLIGVGVGLATMRKP
ncbi:MAG: LysE family translocator [Pyrinomonadaceae bacterium]